MPKKKNKELDEEEEEGEDAFENRKRGKLTMEMEKKEMPYVCSIEIPFASKRSAQLTLKALEVDEELTPQKVVRSIKVEEERLIVQIKSTELRLLRASVSSFFDMCMIAVRFLCEFDTQVKE